MEFVFYPRSFTIQPGQAGDQQVVSVVIQDVSGNTARVIFGAGDWEGFQRFVADPEAAAAAAAARARIVAPGGLAPTIKDRKH